MVESTRLKLQSISERLHSIPNNESFKFNNHSAIFLKGKSLTEADRDIIDSTISEITARTYPKVSISIQKLIKFYSDIDNYNSRERIFTDWWFLLNEFKIPVAYATAYGGGIARKQEKNQAYKAQPRLLYTGEAEAILEHMLFLAPKVFENKFDFPFVVDRDQVDVNSIDGMFHRILQRPLYLYTAKGSFLPFIDEVRMTVNNKTYRPPTNLKLPENLILRRALRNDFAPLKKFLNKTHPINSLDEKSLDEDNGLFYIITPVGNDQIIITSAGLSYPTQKPDGSYLICATDLATDASPEYRDKGLATLARAATLNHLLMGGENGNYWFQGDRNWENAVVVSDIPYQRIPAIKMTKNLGYSQVMIGDRPYIRRWFTAGIMPKRSQYIMND